MSEGMVISEIFHNTRRLTKWYLSFLSRDQMTVDLHCKGCRINSPYWIVAHLTTVESGVVKGMGADVITHPWQKDFVRGNAYKGRQSHWPTLTDLTDYWHDLHKQIGGYIAGLSSEFLDLSYPDSSFHSIFRTNRFAVYHLVRHEGYHCGQLGLICKLHGIDTV